MRGKSIVSFGALAGLLVGQPAYADDDSLSFVPASPWVMDYANDSCGLRREFASGDQRVILKIEQFAPNRDDLQITVAGPRMRWRNPRAPGNATLRFVPDAQAIDIGTPLNITLAGSQPGIVFLSSLMIGPVTSSGLEGEALRTFYAGYDRQARERAVTALEIHNGLVDDLVLQTGSLGPPMGAMRTCLDELLTHWGLDAVAHRDLRREVAPVDFDSWSRAIWRSYPRDMWERGEQALLRIRLIVNAEGRPDSCHTQQRIGQEEFDRQACEIIMGRARFSPAIDAHGNPVASYFLFILPFRQPLQR